MNNWDFGLQQDFDIMTKELGREIIIFLRDDILTSEGQRTEEELALTGIVEVAFCQELDSTHEMIASGLMEVGDVKFQFLSNSCVEEEALVTPDEGITFYKVIKLTKVKNQNNNQVILIKAYGKKIPNR